MFESMRFHKQVSVVCVLSVFSAGQALAQREAGVTPQLVWKTEARFTAVGAARLYGDGSLLLADAGARELYLATAKGVVQQIGRAGDGPGEYRSPQSVHRFRDGLSVVVDPRLRRFSVVDSLGGFKRNIPFPPGAGGLSGRVSADREGRMWFLGSPANLLGSREVPLSRLDVAGGRVDSVSVVVGELLADLSSPAREGTRGPQLRRTLMVVPYAAKDGFAAQPLGGVAVFRSSSRQLEWLDSLGRVTRSRRIPAPFEVDIPSEDLRRIRPEALRKLVPARQMAFEVDFLVAGDKGEVWLRRVIPSDTTRSQWIVLPPQGKERTVTLMRRARLLTVEGSLLVVAEADEDDLESVVVYRLPQ